MTQSPNRGARSAASTLVGSTGFVRFSQAAMPDGNATGDVALARRDNEPMDGRALQGMVSIGALQWPDNEPRERVLAGLLERHLFHDRRQNRREWPLYVRIADPDRFAIRIRSSTLGDLRHCYLDVEPHVYVVEPPGTPSEHLVVLQLSGVSTIRVGTGVLQLQPGEMAMIGAAARVRVEHETRVQQIALMGPLSTAVIQQIGACGLYRVSGTNDRERMVFRWLHDACLDSSWDAGIFSYDVARLLCCVLSEVFACGDRRLATLTAMPLSREGIEAYVLRRLKDRDLSATCIAKAFGCSVRTLHRAFAKAGAVSLGRFIWVQRVLACAHALHDPTAESTSLAEIAIQFGFESPAHFSTLFRDVIGVAPSEYRKRHAACPAATGRAATREGEGAYPAADAMPPPETVRRR